MTSDRDRSVSASGVKDNTPSHPDGFAEPNYTQIPNQFLDNWLPHLTGSETKVLLYVFRRTFGFQKRNGDWIGIRQICRGLPGKDQGTGLHLETAYRAARSLAAKGLLRCHGEGNNRRFLCPVRRDPPAAIRREAPAPPPPAYGKSVHDDAPAAYGKSVHEVYGKSEHSRTENPHTQKKGNKGKERTSSSVPPAELARACREVLPRIDDDAVRTLWMECRKQAPDCTAEEVADTFQMKAAQVLKGRGVRNPVGLLLAAVPKCFEGDTSRRPPTQAAQLQETLTPAKVEVWVKAVDDPTESPEVRQIAAETLADYRRMNPAMVAEVEKSLRAKKKA